MENPRGRRRCERVSCPQSCFDFEGRRKVRHRASYKEDLLYVVEYGTTVDGAYSKSPKNGRDQMHGFFIGGMGRREPKNN